MAGGQTPILVVVSPVSGQKDGESSCSQTVITINGRRKKFRAHTLMVIPSGACLIVPRKYAEAKKVAFEELPSCL